MPKPTNAAPDRVSELKAQIAAMKDDGAETRDINAKVKELHQAETEAARQAPAPAAQGEK